jgi:hypothetical protein
MYLEPFRIPQYESVRTQPPILIPIGQILCCLIGLGCLIVTVVVAVEPSHRARDGDVHPTILGLFFTAILLGLPSLAMWKRRSRRVRVERYGVLCVGRVCDVVQVPPSIMFGRSHWHILVQFQDPVSARRAIVISEPLPNNPAFLYPFGTDVVVRSVPGDPAACLIDFDTPPETVKT